MASPQSSALGGSTGDHAEQVFVGQCLENLADLGAAGFRIDGVHGFEPRADGTARAGLGEELPNLMGGAGESVVNGRIEPHQNGFSVDDVGEQAGALREDGI